jgi:hypothetical protein
MVFERFVQVMHGGRDDANPADARRSPDRKRATIFGGDEWKQPAFKVPLDLGIGFHSANHLTYRQGQCQSHRVTCAIIKAGVVKGQLHGQLPRTSTPKRDSKSVVSYIARPLYSSALPTSPAKIFSLTDKSAKTVKIRSQGIINTDAMPLQCSCSAVAESPLGSCKIGQLSWPATASFSLLPEINEFSATSSGETERNHSEIRAVFRAI